MKSKFDIKRTKHHVEDVHELLIQSEEYAHSLYPPEGVFMLSLDEMDDPNVHLFIVRDENGTAKGCGALVVSKYGTGEIKRMYIEESARGRGLGKLILDKLEDAAKEENVRLIQLETGPLQLAAIKLYERNGYTITGPFGEYQENEMSVFMQKRLK